ncbi:MAG: hypothetical protein FWF97_02820 [Alphaproteobacteria bacterium]|nr:hypothetical protein [Alphaproteobacteria bacterium]
MNPEDKNLAEKLQMRDLSRAIAEIARLFAPLCMHFIDWIIARNPGLPVRFMLRDAETFFCAAKTLAAVSPKYQVCADWTADYLTYNMIDNIPTEYLRKYLSKNWNQSLVLADIGFQGGFVDVLRRFFPDNNYQPLLFASENPNIPGFLNGIAEIKGTGINFKKFLMKKNFVTYQRGTSALALLLEQFPKKEHCPHTLYHREADGTLYIKNDFHQFVRCPDESKPYLYLQNPGLPQIEPADPELHIRPGNKWSRALHHIFFESLRAQVTEYACNAGLPSVKDAILKLYDIAPSMFSMRNFLVPFYEDGFDNYEKAYKKDISRILKMK